VLGVALFIAWLLAFVWDVGILNTLSKDWKIGPFKGPFGNPPGYHEDKSDKDKPKSPEPTNSPSAKK